MVDAPFDVCAADYVHNLLVTTGKRSLSRERCVRLARAGGALGLIEVDEDACEGMGPDAPTMMAALGRYVAQNPDLRAPRKPDEPGGTNLAVLAEILDLDDAEAATLQFICTAAISEALSEVLASVGEVSLAHVAALIADATGQPRRVVTKSLERRGRLVSSGVVILANDVTLYAGRVQVKTGLPDLLTLDTLDAGRLVGRFLPVATASELELSDFAHLGEPVDTLADILRRAVASRARGINILLYGPTGTGKTELAKVLARELGQRLHLVGAADDDGDPPSLGERLSSLMLGQRLVPRGDGLLLFDEMEDLFEERRSPAPWDFGLRNSVRVSKQWLNLLLENNEVPVVWITNTTHGIDPAYLRRFAYAVEFRKPGPGQRARVLSRHLGADTGVAPEDVHAIAGRFAVSPGQLGTAVRTAKLVAKGPAPTRAEIERLLGPMEKLATGTDPRLRGVFDPKGYRLDAVHASVELAPLVERLSTWRPGGVGLSLCLYGPPGTGKSEFGRYLAHRMGRSVVYRRASDLLSAWVGESEKQIATAFAEAADDDAVLLLDEVDSFLRDRKTAVRSWEVTQVNEFLQQLETYRGVVVCTTNLWRDLDAAALRRFVFKLELRFLRPEHVAMLWDVTTRETLNMSVTDGERREALKRLGAVRTLTPGDFAVVVRRTRALGSTPAAAELTTALLGEVEHKGNVVDGHDARAIGF